MPIGVPGWPELAFCTASIASVRIVLMHSRSISPAAVVADADKCCLLSAAFGLTLVPGFGSLADGSVRIVG